MDEEKTIVTMKDVRAARMCFKGSRVWFAKRGLSWMDFLKHGIDAQVLLDSGDAMAQKVVEVARGRQRR
jgi:hypothetical protein